MDKLKKTVTDVSPGSRDEALGDLGGGNRTWAPADGEQGISNRPDDEADTVPPGDEADDARAFGDVDSTDADEDDDGDGAEEIVGGQVGKS